MLEEPKLKLKNNSYSVNTQNKQTLRFLTCGSVDDGKSTLIGRLLHDSKMIYDDQLIALENESKKNNPAANEIDFSLLVDGLQSEREQGITIDVAYRYFSTDKRKFIIADTPGHIQYTRNMVTGASHCELAILLIDASKGVKEQTRRHSFIVSLLGIKNIIVAVNKMDLVNYSQAIFEEICADYYKIIDCLNFESIQFIPLSATKGVNVVNSHSSLNWYNGPSLLEWLEHVPIESSSFYQELCFPVQYVIRGNNFRGYSGTLVNGKIKIDEEVLVLPSRKKTKVQNIITFDAELTQAHKNDAVTLVFEDDLDISRGNVIVHPDSKINVCENFTAYIVWMHEISLQPHRQYKFKFESKYVSGHIDKIEYQIDIDTFQQKAAPHLSLNEIGKCLINVSEVIVVDRYVQNKTLGSFIIIDSLNNLTVGAGMVLDCEERIPNTHYNEFEVELNILIRKYFPHWNAKDIRGC